VTGLLLPVTDLLVPTTDRLLVPHAAGYARGAPAGGAGGMVAGEPVEIELPEHPVLTTIPDVELLYAGTHHCATGWFTWDPSHLASAVAAADDPTFQTPVVKVGHEEPEWLDGEPAMGIIKNLRVNANSTVLSGDLVGVPSWLAQVMPFAFPDRSIEGIFDWNVKPGGMTHPFILTAVALLGVHMGAVHQLADLPSAFAAKPPEGTTVNGKAWEELVA
jgi:hypothetical protein